MLSEREPEKCQRAALRWNARFCREVRSIEPGETLAILVLIGQLGGTRARPAARALAELVYRRRTAPAAEVPLRWADGEVRQPA
jgi:hypothetical protein